MRSSRRHTFESFGWYRSPSAWWCGGRWFVEVQRFKFNGSAVVRWSEAVQREPFPAPQHPNSRSAPECAERATAFTRADEGACSVLHRDVDAAARQFQEGVGERVFSKGIGADFPREGAASAQASASIQRKGTSPAGVRPRRARYERTPAARRPAAICAKAFRNSASRFASGRDLSGGANSETRLSGGAWRGRACARTRRSFARSVPGRAGRNGGARTAEIASDSPATNACGLATTRFSGPAPKDLSTTNADGRRAPSSRTLRANRDFTS